MPIFILLIEDNPGDAIIFREKLNASDLDYKLATAKRLSEGLDRIAETDFDIILVDLSLPDAQGIEAVTQVRKAAPSLPVIVLTGLDDATAAARAKEQGAVDYLVKWYVDSPSLARYIRYAIAQYKMFDGGPADTEGLGRQAAHVKPVSNSASVVEGELIAPHTDADHADTKGSGIAVMQEANARPERERGAADTAAADAQDDKATVLHRAIADADAALLIVRAGGDVVFATDAARTWVPNEEYPWPLHPSKASPQPQTVEQGGVELEQRVHSTVWADEKAYLVQLQERAPRQVAHPTAAGSELAGYDAVLLRDTSEAALTFAEHAMRRTQWMADLLRSALDLHRVVSGEVDVQTGDIDLLDLSQKAVREHRDLSMSYGHPLRVTSERSKAMAYADRNLASALLQRLVVDAVHAAGSDGVELNVKVEGTRSVVAVSWEDGGRDADPVFSACAEHGRRLVLRLADLCSGEAEYPVRAGGRRTVRVRFPIRTNA